MKINSEQNFEKKKTYEGKHMRDVTKFEGERQNVGSGKTTGRHRPTRFEPGENVRGVQGRRQPCARGSLA